MITPLGQQWLTPELAKYEVHALATLWSVSRDKADMIQCGIDTPTQAQLKLLHMQSRTCPPWHLVWDVVPREKPMSGWEHKMKAAILAAHPKRSPAFRAEVWRKLDARIPATISSMRARSESRGVRFDLTANQLRQLFIDGYGKECPYLGVPVILSSTAAKGIAVDHIYPMVAGGPSTLDNLQLISARANRMKDDMTDESFRHLLALCKMMDERSRASVYRRMAAGSSSIYEQKKIAQDQLKREV